MGSSTFLLFSYTVLLSLATLTLSDDVYFEHNCNEIRGNYTANSTYQANLNSIVSQFSSLTEFNYGFFNLSAGVSPDNANVIALCRGDLNQSQCNSCLNYTATELERFCPSNKEATAWSELCLVRYANRDMYGMLENDPRTCAYNPANASNPEQFNQALSELLNDLSSKAADGGPLRKYAAGNATAGNLQTVYATVQCTPDLDEGNCTTCLTFAMNELRNCCYGRMGCRVLRPNCVLRFESNPFYNQIAVPLPSPPPPPSPSTSSFPTSIGEQH
ncbi:cysteine-rich repeat secretory protein 38-like [Durio zibethinus]|uniref:Cysteine-rich repeat secretory protein 38-like n=1 Tax=Durio zibethinus TaxID=66656 RepID=A0A6P5WXH6_DURZI|nr:cysteine-rich repeat secretory protein 38-like [Durio zibethinus]